MSEYPISCNKCGIFLDYVYATRWSDNYLCEKCRKEKLREIKNDTRI